MTRSETRSVTCAATRSSGARPSPSGRCRAGRGRSPGPAPSRAAAAGRRPGTAPQPVQRAGPTRRLSGAGALGPCPRSAAGSRRPRSPVSASQAPAAPPRSAGPQRLGDLLRLGRRSCRRRLVRPSRWATLSLALEDVDWTARARSPQSGLREVTSTCPAPCGQVVLDLLVLVGVVEDDQPAHAGSYGSPRPHVAEPVPHRPGVVRHVLQVGQAEPPAEVGEAACR